MRQHTFKSRQSLILISPIIIIAVGHLVARLAEDTFGVWGWVPMILVIWGMFGLMIAWAGGKDAIRRWWQPPQGGRRWTMLAIGAGLIPMGVFVSGWNLFPSISLVLAWLLFALVNPLLEEGYWRGVLLDCTERWPAWAAIIYSSVFFAINHPLSFGVYSIANQHPAVLISTFVMGVVWAVIYRKTRSLRWVTISHCLTDLLSLSVLTFLNIYVPSIPR
jgi:uncharacterized protein